MEVQKTPNGMIDLWSRDHRKSSCITYGMSIFDIIRSHGENRVVADECTIGIFSHTRPIAKGFLRQIKREFEQNAALRYLFPDIFWTAPQSESPQWSEDSGIIVKRKANPKEATVEAWGLVDGQPTGKHFTILVYDDVVTRESVTTADMVHKTTAAWELSLNLGVTEGGVRRIIGTRYATADTYETIIERGAAIPRIYPATDDGTFDGNPVLWTKEVFMEKARDMADTAAAQLLQDPKQGQKSKLRRTDLRFYHGVNNGRGMNIYITVDPAHSKKRTHGRIASDRTAMGVFGLGQDGNKYLLDAVYDRLDLTERTEELIRLHRQWKPLRVGYERYGAQADIEHIKYVQAQQNYRFDIIELGGTKLSKEDRIERIIPDLRDNRWWWPAQLFVSDSEGKRFDLIEKVLLEEYDLWPFPRHDDFLDMLSRIYDEDMMTTWPKTAPVPLDRYSTRPKQRGWRAR